MKNVMSIERGIYRQMRKGLNEITDGANRFLKSLEELEKKLEDKETRKVLQWRPKK